MARVDDRSSGDPIRCHLWAPQRGMSSAETEFLGMDAYRWAEGHKLARCGAFELLGNLELRRHALGLRYRSHRSRLSRTTLRSGCAALRPP